MFYLFGIFWPITHPASQFPHFCVSVRHPRPGDPGVQGWPAELLHHHQQGHDRQGCGSPHRQWVRPHRSPRDLLPVRGVCQSRGRHKAEAPARPALQACWSNSAQWQVRNEVFKHVTARLAAAMMLLLCCFFFHHTFLPPFYGPPSVPIQLGLYEFFICCQGCLRAA